MSEPCDKFPDCRCLRIPETGSVYCAGNHTPSRKATDRDAELARLTAENARLKFTLERISYHELTWKEARDAARAALEMPDE